jgi:hypothetical protein
LRAPVRSCSISSGFEIIQTGGGEQPRAKNKVVTFRTVKKSFFTAKSRTRSTAYSSRFKSAELAIFPPKKSVEINKNAKHRIAEEAHKERGRRTEKSRTFVPAAAGSRPAELQEPRIRPPGRKERPRVEIYSHRFPIARREEGSRVYEIPRPWIFGVLPVAEARVMREREGDGWKLRRDGWGWGFV